jgi:pimeloyl-ACP methyl ester carboxylesterase
MMPISENEKREIQNANESGRMPVVFVHGLWLLASSWDRWRRLFEDAGYATLAPSWPDDPETVEEARKHPEVFARKKLQQITDHHADVIRQLRTPPAIIGHSIGGLVAQKLAGMGLASVTVAIDPAPFQGVLPLPISTIKATFPAIGNPTNWSRAIALTYDQFRYAFANAVSETEAHALFEAFPVAGAAAPLFQSATANVNPWSEARVDTTNPARGPLLVLSGEKDHTVPWAIANAAYHRQKRNPGLTEIRELAGRGHSLTIDSGWQEVAEAARSFVDQHRGDRATVEAHP